MQVHCRTGSLEIKSDVKKDVPKVHCRTGSLERSPAMTL